MREYVAFLNQLHQAPAFDLEAIEAFWINRVNQYFSERPFKIKPDQTCSLRTVVRDVIVQAEERQKVSTGVSYAGAVLQHLVGAKLDCALGKGMFEHHGFATADLPGGCHGDFVVGDVVIHVTTAPGEAVLERCRQNLESGYRSVLITVRKRLGVAEGPAANIGLSDRIDIFEAEQFIALNLHEISKFSSDGRKVAIHELVQRYNEIIDSFEADPSLRIELSR